VFYSRGAEEFEREINDMNLKIIAIAGASSNVGKTTLLCELLTELSRHEPWEAIKLTRGHYRSCGKDPHACCVSDLLGDEPVIRSGRAETYTLGKDTGRYWDAGAANVHWVIATNDQVEQGIKRALARVETGNVLIEGTSFLKFIKADLALLVARADQTQIKPSARAALLNKQIDAAYLTSEGGAQALYLPPGDLPTYTQHDLPKLIEVIRRTANQSAALSV
jgi:molybdopterin-guanine dinucleotide biosynthesis protein